MTVRAHVYWNRLVPYSQTPDFMDNMQARIADPLWMLGRQWQLGEFQGEDAGSLIDTELITTLSPLVKFRPRGDQGSPIGVPYHPPTQPLETMVERESVRQRPGGVGSATELRSAAEAGAHFLRLLSDRGFASTDYDSYRAAFIAAYPMPSVAADKDAPSRRFAKLMAGRMADGLQLEAALRAALAAPVPSIPPEVDVDFGANEPAVLEVAAEWLAWWDELMSEAGVDESTWVEQRLEHRFDVGVQLYDQTGAAGAEIVLAADEYPGGRLDWSTFDFRVNPDNTPADPLPGTPSDDTWAERTIEYRGLPAPIEIGGMPTPRFWEMEEGRVDLSRLEPAADDLGRMLLMEFVLVHSNDWQLIPLDVPVGTVLRVASLKATDTFGNVLAVRPSPAVGDSNEAWGMYQLSPRTEAGQTPAPLTGEPLFLMPPVLGAFQQGEPIEQVRFLRDEMANLAWGVERIVPSPLGAGHDRLEEEKERVRREQGTSWADLSVEGLARYELATTVPRYWIPLLPAPSEEEGRKNRFLAGRMLQPDGVTLVHPQGTILQNDLQLPPVAPLYAFNEGVLETNSETYVDSGCQTLPLAAGIDYLVIYGASCSNDLSSGFCDVRLMHGTVVVGEAGMESSTIGISSLPGVGQKQQGFLRVTGNGATLRLQYRDRDGNDSQIDGQYIIAIPLDGLVEGQDYFYTGSAAAADEIAAQGSAAWGTLRTTSSLGAIPDGQYLVLMSCEARFSGAGSDASGCMIRARVNGQALFPTAETDDAHQVEWEDNTDIFCWAVCGIENVANANANSFAIEVKSRNATTTAYRRSNIWLIKTSAFDQIVQRRASAGATTGAAYPPGAVFTALDTVYQPNQSETVVVLSMAQPGQTSTGSAAVQDLLLGDGSARATSSGQGFRDVSAAGADNWPVTMAAVQELSTEAQQTYRLRFGTLGGGTASLNTTRNKTNGPVANLIIWSMNRSRVPALPTTPNVTVKPFWVWEEEIPRAGAHVTRRYEYARWNDGSSHLWVARATRPGLGEGSSRLAFDGVVEGAETVRPTLAPPVKVAITPIAAFQDAQQSTTSATPVSANCETAPLAAGVDYLVIYRGSCGNSSATDSGVLRLRFGASVELGFTSSEGSGNDNHFSGDQCQGFARVSGNGTDRVSLLLNQSGGSTAFAGSMAIVAIPLSELVPNVDLWHSGAEGPTTELSNAPVTPTVLRQLSFELAEPGDYLILMSCEGSPGTSAANACQVSFQLDGSRWGDGAANQDWVKEHEANDDWFSFAFAGVETLTAGSHTLAIRVASRSTASASFRRSRIWVIRAAAFDQIRQVRETAGTTTTSSAFVDYVANAYAPNQQEHVVVLGATSIGQSGDDASAVCQLVTASGVRNVDAGANLNDGGFDGSSDRPTVLLCATESIAAAVNYRLQISDGHVLGTAKFGRNRENTAGAQTNLIVWSMTYLRSAED